MPVLTANLLASASASASVAAMPAWRVCSGRPPRLKFRSPRPLPGRPDLRE